jgi:hypothetical protein
MLTYTIAQTNYTLFPDNAIWSVNTVKYKTFGDTVINNPHYLKVYQQEKLQPFEFDINKANYFCAIRNDTVNKKVLGIYHKPTGVRPYPDYRPENVFFINGYNRISII